MENISKDQLHELTNSLQQIVGENTESDDFVQTLVNLLSLPEDQFEILAPGIMQSFQQTINNPNDKITLVQSLNASGNKAEDLTSALMEVADGLEESTLSRQKRDFLKEMMASIANAINDTEGIAKRNVPVAIELCHPDAKMPQYAHVSDSGMDVYAVEDVTIHPGETVLVPTGIKVALPVGFEIQVRPKSGRALKTKLRVANTPGTVDQGYRDEIKVILENVEPPIQDITYDFDENGRPIITSIVHGADYTIAKGEKFCQFVLCEVPKAALYRIDNVKDLGEDRGGGFGSTGLV